MSKQVRIGPSCVYACSTFLRLESTVSFLSAWCFIFFAIDFYYNVLLQLNSSFVGRVNKFCSTGCWVHSHQISPHPRQSLQRVANIYDGQKNTQNCSRVATVSFIPVLVRRICCRYRRHRESVYNSAKPERNWYYTRTRLVLHRPFTLHLRTSVITSGVIQTPSRKAGCSATATWPYNEFEKVGRGSSEGGGVRVLGLELFRLSLFTYNFSSGLLLAMHDRPSIQLHELVSSPLLR